MYYVLSPSCQSGQFIKIFQLITFVQNGYQFILIDKTGPNHDIVYTTCISKVPTEPVYMYMSNNRNASKCVSSSVIFEAVDSFIGP